MNLGLHITRTPAGTYGFVGSIPASIYHTVPATKGDVMGGRAFRGDDGQLMAPCVPSFPTEAEARAYAHAQGATLAN